MLLLRFVLSHSSTIILSSSRFDWDVECDFFDDALRGSSAWMLWLACARDSNINISF